MCKVVQQMKARQGHGKNSVEQQADDTVIACSSHTCFGMWAPAQMLQQPLGVHLLPLYFFAHG